MVWRSARRQVSKPLGSFGSKQHLSASSRSVNSDNDEFNSISSPRHKSSASSSSNIFTRKSVNGIVEEDVIIEGQSSYEVIDVDNFETFVGKRRKNTQMKAKKGDRSEPSTFGEKMRNISVRLPSLPDETNDISYSWTKESLSKSFVSSSILKPNFQFSAKSEMKGFGSDSDESLPDLVSPESSTRTGKLALGKVRVESMNPRSIGTNSDVVESTILWDHITEDKINMIKAILPNTITNLIRNTLLQCRGDVQASVSILLDSQNDT